MEGIRGRGRHQGVGFHGGGHGGRGGRREREKTASLATIDGCGCEHEGFGELVVSLEQLGLWNGKEGIVDFSAPSSTQANHVQPLPFHPYESVWSSTAQNRPSFHNWCNSAATKHVSTALTTPNMVILRL